MGVVIKIIKWILAIVLAAAFIAAGANKLTGQIHPATHTYLTKASTEWIKVTPWNLTGWSAETLRVVIGLTEVTFGLLALCPLYTRLSAFVFIGVMSGATWTHFTLHEPFIVPAALAGASFLLFLVSGDSVAKPAASANKKKQ